MAAKTTTSFALADETKLKIKLIAEHERRSQANALEIIVDREFERLGLKLPAQPSTKKP